MVCLTPQLFLPVYMHANVGLPSPQAATSPALPAATLPALVLQLLPCCESSPPGCPSPPLLLVWMNVSSLTPWLSDFHTVLFSISSGCFLFLNMLLSFFWLCWEAQCVYLRLHLRWKSPFKVIIDRYLFIAIFSLRTCVRLCVSFFGSLKAVL